MVNILEIRRLLQYEVVPVAQDEIAYDYINNVILHNRNKLIPRLFNKILVILSSMQANSRPIFYNSPQTIHFAIGTQSYSGEIIKRLNTSKLKGDVFEVKIDQHPDYYRMQFIMENNKLVSFLLFTFCFTKRQFLRDYKTNYYCVLSDQLSTVCHIHKKGVDYQ